MTIYQLTYLSEELPVRAYLGIPDHVQICPNDILILLRARYGAHSGVTVEVVPTPAPATAVPVRPGPLPGLVYCRGGIGRVGMAKLDWIHDFMAHGVVVMAPWYRGTYGGPGSDEFGGADCEDVNEAFRLVRSLPFVQPDRVAALGFSRGAINAARLAATLPGVHHLILWGGVADLAWTYEERVDLRRMLRRVLGKSPMRRPEAYASRSPAHFAQAIRCPVLIVHGTEDVQVPYRHAERMCEALQRAHRPFALHTYSGYGHHLPPAVRRLAIRRMLEHVFQDP
ncbi:putative peptidase YtmA [Alicyclobacillus contaminans]|uniref:alpha/beta hydrolase family protein n=1 Tax=Alicyclobacillus contaminans TaxID=392016 RepID=UPI000420EAC7|nr:prolyl oligopeptidase family serine peptidase [Alicyclobacillus contaminans]GMA50814.1 putative peptidase YtmA [Alicyclobacillus contaminans]